MAKGAEEKQIVIDKIKEVFPEAFEYDKTVRIPIGDVQIKVALTCAKDIVEPGADNALPTPITKGGSAKAGKFSFPEPQKIEVTDNEKTAVQDLMSSLGL